MKLVYSRRAQSDLAEIHAHVAAQDQDQARSIARELKAHCEALCSYSRLNPTTEIPNVRRMPHTRYPFTVYYRVNENLNHVLILRVVRSSRVRRLGRVPR